MRKKIFKAKKNGSVLILVLWALGLLSVFAIYLGVGARGRIDFLSRIETRSKTTAAAESAVKQAISFLGNLDKEKYYIALKDISSLDIDIINLGSFEQADFIVGYDYRWQDLSIIQTESFEKMYGVQDALSKININTAKRRVLKNLFVTVCELSEDKADKIASSIIDWRDKDLQPLANGAEDKYYGNLNPAYQCKDNKFESIEELRYIRAMDHDIYIKIEPYITIFGSGSVNINTAPFPVLEALGMDQKVAEKVLIYRCGEDQVAATGDDRVFESVSSIVARLSQVESLSASQLAQFSNLAASGCFTVFSDLYEIQAESKVKNYGCRIRSVFKKDLNIDSKKAGLFLSNRRNYF